MRTAQTIALLIFLAASTFAALEVGWLSRGMRLDLIPKAQAVVQQASTTIENANTALDVQQSYWASELRETRKATADLHDLLIHTDVSLNGKRGDGGVLGEIYANTLPRMGRTLDSGSDAIRSFSDRSDRVLADSDANIRKVGPLVEALTARVDDPRYDAILSDAAASMENLRRMTADGKQVSSDTAAFVHRELAPVKGVWNTLKAIVNQTWAVRGAIGF